MLLRSSFPAIFRDVFFTLLSSFLCVCDTLKGFSVFSCYLRVTGAPCLSSQARAGAKKFRKVTLTVSPKGIIVTDTETADLIENVSIYR